MEARRDEDFLIIARCNAPQVEGMQRALERAEAYEDAGAHLIMMRTRAEAEFAEMSGKTRAPLATLASWTVKPEPEMLAAGYALVLDPNSLTIATYHALTTAYKALGRDPWYGLGREAVLSARAEVQELVGLDELYRIEAETTEKETLARLAGGSA